MTGPEDGKPQAASRLGWAGWIAIAVLTGFLGWAGWYAVHVWTRLAGVSMSLLGWFFMILGALVTLALGGGLMALVFYSNRKGKDF